jgi:hypothetical protein
VGIALVRAVRRQSTGDPKSADTDWKLWGNGLKSIDIFTNEAVPDTDNYQNWYDWAEALLAAINPRVG